jgi:hypothetical protein
MSLILSGSDGLSDIDGSASTPAIRGTDANTGIFFPAADTIAFGEGGAEVMRINSSGQVLIGTTSPSGSEKFRVSGTDNAYSVFSDTTNSVNGVFGADGSNSVGFAGTLSNHAFQFRTNNTERARIDSSGNMMVGKAALALGNSGVELYALGEGAFTRSAAPCLYINRLADDGDLVRFFQATTQEGSISVSGTTVSYNGGHLSRWAQMPGTKDDTLVKGTVMSNLDEMNVYTDAEGNPVDNEQLNKVKVSDVEGDVNVAGVFVNWDYDEQHQVDEINMAMTGDMIIRIAQGVVVQKGDLLMSAGDGTAKPQEDDIVRSKTVAKVTSNHVTCTYADGSYCVPCVLMAC